MALYSKTVPMYQQTSIANQVVIGQSDGATQFQEFTLPDGNVLKETLIIKINSIVWSQVSTFVDSGAFDTVYKVIPLTNGGIKVRVGNGTYGMIPPAYDVNADYAVGGGENSNITALNFVSAYAGSDSNIVGVANAESMSGGANEETIENAKKVAPILLKSRGRFVEVEDGEALAMQYGGLSFVKLWPNYYGPLTCRLFGIAIGGGNPSSALRHDISDYLKSLSVMDSIEVFFDEAIFISVDVRAFIKVMAGYDYVGGVDKYVDIALKLFLTENGTEIKSKYLNLGISYTVDFINTIFSTSFSSEDYTQLSKLIDALKPATFGMTIHLSDISGYVDSFVDGVDYIDMSFVGTGLPMMFSPDQISTPGTFFFSESV
jgi:hypothetical protein